MMKVLSDFCTPFQRVLWRLSESTSSAGVAKRILLHWLHRAGNNAYFVRKDKIEMLLPIGELALDEGYVKSVFRNPGTKLCLLTSDPRE